MQKFVDCIEVPCEISDVIFSYLHWKDLENCHYVCHAWRKRVLSTDAWKQMCINEGYKVPAKASDIPSYGGDKPLSYRELFYRLKYREDNWESMLESKLMRIHDWPTLEDKAKYINMPVLREYRDVDKGLIGYEHKDEELIGDVEIYNCITEEVTFRKENIHVRSLCLLDGVLMMHYYVEGSGDTTATWDALTGEIICGEYDFPPRCCDDRYFDVCSKELNLLVGHDECQEHYREASGIINGNLVIWNLKSGKLLYKKWRQGTAHEMLIFHGAYELCLPPKKNTLNDSFYIIWTNSYFAFDDTSLWAQKFRCDPVEELDYIHYTKSQFGYKNSLHMLTMPHEGKLRIISTNHLQEDATEKGSTLQGREVALDFRTDITRNGNCFLEDPTDDSQDYKYIGTSFELDDELMYPNFVAVGDVYEVVTHCGKGDILKFWPSRVHEVEIFKFDARTSGKRDRHLVARIQCSWEWKRYSSFIVDHSWLDGLNGENDSGLFMINPKGRLTGYRNGGTLARTSWRKIWRLKQRAVLGQE